MHLDHVVLWVGDPLLALAFYTEALGLAPVRGDEFRGGSAPFPSVRVSDRTILDLVPRAAADAVRAVTGERGRSAAGEPINHLCLAMSADELARLRTRLEARGVATTSSDAPSFGAAGTTRSWFYFQDPDGNVLEARAY